MESPAVTLTLRDVAGRLGEVPMKVAVDQLFTLLKAGRLAAGFEFPGRRLHWIAISTTYWSTVPSDQFRSILVSKSKSELTGSYKVQISTFADQFLDIVAGNGGGDLISVDYDELLSGLKNASREFEVVIRESDWLKYFQQLPAKPDKSFAPGKGGRSPLKGWRTLAPIICHHIISHHKRSPDIPIKIDHAAKEIFDIATREDVHGLPAAATIGVLVSEILQRLEEHPQG